MYLNANRAELILIAEPFTDGFKMSQIAEGFDPKKKKQFSNLIYPLVDAGVFNKLDVGHYEHGPKYQEFLKTARSVDLGEQRPPRVNRKKAAPPPPPALNISNSAQDFLEQTSMLIKENADLRQALTDIRNTVDHLLGE